MNLEVTHALVRGAARVCRWPPVRIGSTLVADRGAWEHVSNRASPVDLVLLIRALEPHLLRATDGARERLALRLPWNVDPEPLVIGDLCAVPLVNAALALVSEPARVVLRHEVVFVATGTESAGFCCSARFVDAYGHLKATMISVGPAVTVGLLCHELGHAWCRPMASELSQAIGAQGEERLRHYMLSVGAGEQLAKMDRDDEVVADALAAAWAYAEPAARSLPA